MYVICLKSKYGYCKYGNHCNKINFTDECEMLDNVTRNIVINATRSYAIILKSTRYGNLAFTDRTNICYSTINKDILTFVKKLTN